METPSRIAFLGTGAMGVRMAPHLLDATDELVVYNRTRQRTEPLARLGARIADSPRTAVEGANVVVSIVTDDDAARALWLDPTDGAALGVVPGTLVLECSTVTPGWIDALGAALEARGARLVDAPAVGTLPHAEARQLTFLVGGAADDLPEASSVLDHMGARVLHAGPRGRGALLKLLVNALFVTQVAQLGELLAAASALGYELDLAAEHLASLPVVSPAGQGALALMRAGDHAPRFPVSLVAKDLGYASALGEVPITEAARRAFEAARDGGLGDHNLTAIVEAARR